MTNKVKLSKAGVAAGVALGAVAVGAAAVAVGSQCLQLARTRSGLARVRKLQDDEGHAIRVLQQDGVYQSATYLDERRFEPVFAYYRAFDAMFEADPVMRAEQGHGVDRVLMLGGGGYAYPKHALTQHGSLFMDVVEIDPGITRLARQWFYLDELERMVGPRLGLVTADARTYLEQAAESGARYDVVINDCFAGSEPVRGLVTVEALSRVKAILRPGGMYLANVVTADAGDDISFLRDAAATAAEVFERVHIVPCEDSAFGVEDNYLLVATDGAYAFCHELLMSPEVMGSVLRDA